jgi:hypothetical protein
VRFVDPDPLPGPLTARVGGRRGQRSAFFREVILVAGAMLLYFGVRNLTSGSETRAVGNALRVFDLERSLGLALEKAAQSLVLGSGRLVDLSNWVYIWGHWPPILLSAVVLFLFRKERYLLLRDAMFVSGAIGFLFFALFPVAPPRLLDLGLIDTVTERSNAYRTLQPPGLTNQFAAFPSLHAGWNLLLGIVLFTSTRHPLVRAVAVVSPIMMSLSVVTTANHFVLDVPAGYAVVLFGLWVSHRIRRGDRRTRRAATLGRDGFGHEQRRMRQLPVQAVSHCAPRRQ